jgi:oligoendopeptidase F
MRHSLKKAKSSGICPISIPRPMHGVRITRKTEAAARALLSYEDTLGRSAAAMLKALDDITAVNKQVQRLIVYASLKADEDRAAAHDQQRMQQANALLTLVDENTAWVKPEILAIGAGKIATLKNADKNLALRFGFYLDNMLRAVPHALGAEGEAAIALTEDERSDIRGFALPKHKPAYRYAHAGCTLEHKFAR